MENERFEKVANFKLPILGCKFRFDLRMSYIYTYINDIVLGERSPPYTGTFDLVWDYLKSTDEGQQVSEDQCGKKARTLFGS